MKIHITTRQVYKAIIALCLAIFCFNIYLFLFSPLLKKSDTTYLYIDADDSIDSVYVKLKPLSHKANMSGFCTLVRHFNYAAHIHPGRYEIGKRSSAFSVFRKLKNGQQTPLRLTVPCVRTRQKLASALSDKLMLDSATLSAALNNEDTCARYGLDTCTIISLFIPNTYEIYWTVTLEQLLNRMKKESDAFWTAERREKAQKLYLSPVEVITLASIVDEETNNVAEKPDVAGMYYNRLTHGMPLQADPTVKYALQQFDIKRIYSRMLSTESPYNTYRHQGLPPGPIRIPSINAIDAVLNLNHHNYLYMCASEKLDGTHRFAQTYAEHLQNAAAYQQKLNERGIH